MAQINDVSKQELLEKTADKLKKGGGIKPPAWASFVKTGVAKDRPPVKEDWWYTRAAAVLLKIYNHGPIGVSKLRTYYGDKKNRGVAPEKFYRASGSILRKVLQQLESAGLAKQVEKGIHKGRIITKEGKTFLDHTAEEISKAAPKKAEAPKKKEKPKEKPKEEKKEKPAKTEKKK